jgi:hypothetical protein
MSSASPRAPPKRQKVDIAFPSNTFKSATAHFQNCLHIHKVRGDGNCLFRALLVALNESQDSHNKLLAQAAQHITVRWSLFADQASYIHRLPNHPDQSIQGASTKKQKRCKKRPSSKANHATRFTLANEYEQWMKTPNSVWSSNMEALAVAQLMDRPLLIWSDAFRQHGFLLNFTIHNIGKFTCSIQAITMMPYSSTPSRMQIKPDHSFQPRSSKLPQRTVQRPMHLMTVQSPTRALQIPRPSKQTTSPTSLLPAATNLIHGRNAK